MRRRCERLPFTKEKTCQTPMAPKQAIMVFLPIFYIVGIRPKGVGYGSPCARPRSGRSAGLRADVRGNEGKALYCKRTRTEAQTLAPRSLHPVMPEIYLNETLKVTRNRLSSAFHPLGCRRYAAWWRNPPGPRPPHFVRQPWLSMGRRYAPLVAWIFTDFCIKSA